MKNPEPIIHWLKIMSQLIPPSGIVLVGAGEGECEWVKFFCELPDTTTLLVEADVRKYKILKSIADLHPSWQSYNEVISNDAATSNFYDSSISSENSLINPDLLKSIWPNLITHKATPRQTISLEELAGEAEVDWLLIDCLPALPIIEGKGKCLLGINLIVARVLFSTSVADLNSATLQTLQTFLESQGFRLHAVDVFRHPSLGHALFIRIDCQVNRAFRKKLADAEARIESLLPKLADADSKIASYSHLHTVSSQQSEKIIELKNVIETLTKENARLVKEGAEKLVQLQLLQSDHSELMAGQRLIDEEISKARMQIDLLEQTFNKDLDQ